ncbi:single strand DNA binding protein [Vibrio phage D270]
MSALDMLKLNPEVDVEEDRDTLGGGAPLTTDVYPATCQYMYLDQTASGAIMAYGNFLVDGKGVRFSECIMSKKSGTLKATYTDKQSGKEKPLPGYSKVVHLAQAIGLNITDLSALTAEPKLLKLWDNDKKAEVPQEKNVITDFSDAKLQIALYSVIETKMAKDGKGNYTVPTAEERTFNEIVKWFTEDGQTIDEVKKQAPAEFREKWIETHQGKVKDKRVKNAPKAGAPDEGSTAPKLKFD